MSALPEAYKMEYMLFTLTKSFDEYENMRNKNYRDIMLYCMLRKFDNWVENERSKFKST